MRLPAVHSLLWIQLELEAEPHNLMESSCSFFKHCYIWHGVVGTTAKSHQIHISRLLFTCTMMESCLLGRPIREEAGQTWGDWTPPGQNPSRSSPGSVMAEAISSWGTVLKYLPFGTYPYCNIFVGDNQSPSLRVPRRSLCLYLNLCDGYGRRSLSLSLEFLPDLSNTQRECNLSYSLWAVN